MIIQYASDLHLEFPENKGFLKTNPLNPEGEILVLAGDIVPFAVMDKHADFFKYASDHFKTTYWIPGNHEYYRFDAVNKSGILNEKIRDNVFLVNNITVQNENIRYIFTTLWSKIRPAYEWQIEKSMNDFYVIKYKGSRFSSVWYNQFHDESLLFINHELNNNFPGKTIVITHHVPTFMNYPKKYLGSVLNDAFAVELFDLIEEKSPDYWIYGHSHCNTPVFIIGKTQLLTNQLGYVMSNEHQLFNTSANFIV